jgi:hypothetical protein
MSSTEILGVTVPKKQKGDKLVSYTQFSMYDKCPKSWELVYARKMSKYEPNEHLLFGTAIHTTIQEWLDSIFNGDGVYDYSEMFKHHMLQTFDGLVTKYKQPFSTPETLTEFYHDGISILEYFGENYRKYFNPRKYDFLGSEIPVLRRVHPEKGNLKFIAYLDLVFMEKSTGVYHIIDIKTSTKGWGYYQLSDMTKISQLLLYKMFFADMYNVDISKIKVKYFIVKRKDSDYMDVDSKVQEYEPVQGSESCISVLTRFMDFIKYSFDSTGSPNVNIEYPAIAGDRDSNCRFCEFAEREDLCPKNKRT